MLKAYELLGDGEWHDYHQTVAKLSRVVPPAIALRYTERQRFNTARSEKNYVDPSTRKIKRPTETLIRIGATAKARELLAGSVRFEIDPRGPFPAGTPKKVRIRPDAPPLWRPPHHGE